MNFPGKIFDARGNLFCEYQSRDSGLSFVVWGWLRLCFADTKATPFDVIAGGRLGNVARGVQHIPMCVTDSEFVEESVRSDLRELEQRRVGQVNEEDRGEADAAVDLAVLSHLADLGEGEEGEFAEEHFRVFGHAPGPLPADSRQVDARHVGLVGRVVVEPAVELDLLHDLQSRLFLDLDRGLFVRGDAGDAVAAGDLPAFRTQLLDVEVGVGLLESLEVGGSLEAPLLLETDAAFVIDDHDVRTAQLDDQDAVVADSPVRIDHHVTTERQPHLVLHEDRTLGVAFASLPPAGRFALCLHPLGVERLEVRAGDGSNLRNLRFRFLFFHDLTPLGVGRLVGEILSGRAAFFSNTDVFINPTPFTRILFYSYSTPCGQL